MTFLQLPDLALDMEVLAKSLIVLGSAFFVSGLVFLLPNRRAESVARNIERAQHHLDQMRRDPKNRDPGVLK